jgi:hypothetical protein
MFFTHGAHGLKGVVEQMSVLVHTKAMGNIVVKNVDDDIRRRFKALCAMEDKSMTEKLTEMIQRELEKKKK